jgi:hypothetical protein
MGDFPDAKAESRGFAATNRPRAPGERSWRPSSPWLAAHPYPESPPARDTPRPDAAPSDWPAILSQWPIG